MTAVRWLIVALFVTSVVAAVLAAGIRKLLRIGEPQDDPDMPDYVSPEDRRETERLRESG